MTTYTPNTVLAANDALRATGKPELAMVEVANSEGDFPLGVTGKSLKRHLREKYRDLVVYLADHRSNNLATSAALA